jgi:hypothetical protein
MQKEEVGEIWGIGVGRQSTVVRTCKGSRPSVLHLTEFEPDNAVGRSHGSGGLGDKETCSKVESTSVLSEPKGKSCGPLQWNSFHVPHQTPMPEILQYALFDSDKLLLFVRSHSMHVTNMTMTSYQ